MKRLNFEIIIIALIGILNFFLFQNCSGDLKVDPNSGKILSAGSAQNHAVDFTFSRTGSVVTELQIKTATDHVVSFSGPVTPDAEYHFAIGPVNSANCLLTPIVNSTSTQTLNCAVSGQSQIVLGVIWPDGSTDQKMKTVSVSVSGVATPTPTPGPTATPAPPNGALLYANNCAGCHAPLATSAKRMRTAVQIQNAIVNVPVMQGLAGLTAAEIQAIATALNF